MIIALKSAVALVPGPLFGIDFAISGMADPARVLDILDFAGAWDQSLVIVLAGAIAISMVGIRLAGGMRKPALAERFDIPASRRIDGRPIGGPAIFGVGWGLAGFCPCPGGGPTGYPDGARLCDSDAGRDVVLRDRERKGADRLDRSGSHHRMISHYSDHAANERTYLAWVRTAIAVMAFGFIVEKFDVFLQVAARSFGGRAPTPANEAIGDIAGLLLIVLGAFMMVVATIRFRQVGRDIDAQEIRPGRGTRMDITLVGLLLCLATTLFAYLAYTVAGRLL